MVECSNGVQPAFNRRVQPLRLHGPDRICMPLDNRGKGWKLKLVAKAAVMVLDEATFRRALLPRILPCELHLQYPVPLRAALKEFGPDSSAAG